MKSNGELEENEIELSASLSNRGQHYKTTVIKTRNTIWIRRYYEGHNGQWYSHMFFQLDHADIEPLKNLLHRLTMGYE